MSELKTEYLWARCERVWGGNVCGKVSRHRKGKTCNTCYARLWREKNLERDRAIRAAYYKRNAAHCKLQWQEYYERNKEERKLASAIWRRNNVERMREYERARRAAKKAARAGVPAERSATEGAD